MASRTKSCAFVLGALLFASPALATPSGAERETARRFMDEGNARMKANDPQQALESFLKAHELMHVPTTGIAVAKAQLASGHLVEAYEAAVEVARTQKGPGEPAVFEKARKHAREIEAQVKGRIPTVRIHIRGGTANHVAVDDVEIPLALIVGPVPVNPGKRVITAKAADGSEGRVEVELRESDKSETDLTLVPPKGDSSKTDNASDSSSSTQPQTRPEKPKVLGFGNEDVNGRGARRAPLAEGLIWGGFGVGAVGLGVGVVTGVMTLGKASNVKPQCANNICALEAKDDLDSASSLATVSTIAFIFGIGGIGAGILGLVIPTTTASGPPARTGWTIRPTASGMGGTF